MTSDVSFKTGDLVVAGGHYGSFILLDVSADGIAADIQLFSHSKQKPIGPSMKVPTSTLTKCDPLRTRVEHIREWLSEQAGLPVHAEGDGDHRCYRFHIGDPMKPWQYILDVYMGDVNDQDALEVIENLRSSKWLDVLNENSGKAVAYFKDKAFKSAEFREWPKAVSYKKA